MMEGFSMKEIILKVEGMACSGCENRVQNALKTIEGVEDVKARYIDKRVKITFNQDVSKSILKEKIEELGYEVIE